MLGYVLMLVTVKKSLFRVSIIIDLGRVITCWKYTLVRVLCYHSYVPYYDGCYCLVGLREMEVFMQLFGSLIYDCSSFVIYHG